MNTAQQMGLVWKMNSEVKETIDLEKLRATNMGLATNPATSKDFIMSMLNEKPDEIEYVTDKGWTTPQSVAEIEQFLAGQDF